MARTRTKGMAVARAREEEKRMAMHTFISLGAEATDPCTDLLAAHACIYGKHGGGTVAEGRLVHLC